MSMQHEPSVIEAVIEILNRDKSAAEIAEKTGVESGTVIHFKERLFAAFPELFINYETPRLSLSRPDPAATLQLEQSDVDILVKTIHRLKNQIEQNRTTVENVKKLKNEFLSNINHELRTPLNSILTLTRVLLMKTGNRLSEEERRDYLEIIERNGKNLLSLIVDIIELSKIESGAVDIRPRDIAVQKLIELIIENFEQTVDEKGITLSLECAPDLPLIESDEHCLLQIFQNIIGNAVKFTERGGVSISISGDGYRMAVRVADTGIGIAEEDLPSIFEEFRQLDGTLERNFEGTGLGLTIASRLVHLLSGSIDVESAKGKGSVFTVYLPLKWPGTADSNGREVPDEPGEPADQKEAVSRGEEAGRRRILIIEDDPDSMIIVKLLLAEEYDVIEAADGRSGLARALNDGPDVILLDMALPHMNGFMVVRQLRENGATRNIPVIAMTALSLEGDRRRIIEAGCSDYLAKPLRVDLLREKVREWAEKRDEYDTGH